jgi:hypothetical protein
VTLAERGTCRVRAAARKGEGIYDPEVSGPTDKKNQWLTTWVPVLKLTQVGEKKILSSGRPEVLLLVCLSI